MNSNEIIQLFGLLYFIIGLGFLFNKKYYKGVFKKIVKYPFVISLLGLISLVIGFSILLFFNTFSFSIDGLVAIIGVISFIKGTVILIFPESFNSTIKSLSKIKKPDFMIFCLTILGLFFMYLGFLY